SLVLFFAGHGHTTQSMLGEAKIDAGYLVPADARIDRLGDLIDVDGFLNAVARLPARHILVILDSCNSGIALDGSATRTRGRPRFLRDLEGRRSRKVITSARANQLATDGGPSLLHSLFTKTLIDGLELGNADRDGNGVVTSLELGLYLEQTVGEAT